jgi:hypothetical protein
MQITIPCEYVRKPNQPYLVGSETKNTLPTGEQTMDCDWMGLSCLVMDESLDASLNQIGRGVIK